MINYKEFLKIIALNNSTILCGNGLSINFDKNFRTNDLINRLYSTHCYIKSNVDFDVCANAIYKKSLIQNYNNTLDFLDMINNKKDFECLFADAIKFAILLTDNKAALLWLDENGFNSRLTFGLKHLDLVFSIVQQARENGSMYVNYEYWTVLIYYILALKNIPEIIFTLDESNIFIAATLKGAKLSLINDTINGTNLYIDTSANGLYTYLRFLFTSNILLEGNSYNVEKLHYWKKYDIDKISNFFSNFNYLITTNYDLLLENITHRSVAHLHGYFSREKKRVLSQSLGIFYNNIRYDLSTAVIGDYFLSKTFLQITAKTASKQPQNSCIENYDEILKRILLINKSNAIVIFGLNMDNDFHILRDLQIFLGTSGVSNPIVIYCFFNDNDKDSFLKAWDSCLTYSKDLCNNIKEKFIVLTMDSQEIISNNFKLL